MRNFNSSWCDYKNLVVASAISFIPDFNSSWCDYKEAGERLTEEQTEISIPLGAIISLPGYENGVTLGYFNSSWCDYKSNYIAVAQVTFQISIPLGAIIRLYNCTKKRLIL